VGFTLFDSNNDGTLDASEIDAAPAALAKLDKNGDGQVTSDEVRTSMPQGRGRGPGGGRGEGEGGAQVNIVEETVKTLMAFDANGDGKLSRSELPERFQGIFDRGDENHDGFLTPDEIRKVATAQAAPPESAGPGRGGREGGREGGRGEGGRGPTNFIRMDPVLAAIDTDGDGVLSPEEIRKSPAAIRKLDKDGDGNVTRAEAMPSNGQGRPF
jgi:Ca2+-binding EF-hand superfamily protein